MKKAIMNTMIILFALAMCVGCGQSSEQKEESVPTDVTKAENKSKYRWKRRTKIRWKMESRYLGW